MKRQVLFSFFFLVIVDIAMAQTDTSFLCTDTEISITFPLNVDNKLISGTAKGKDFLEYKNMSIFDILKEYAGSYPYFFSSKGKSTRLVSIRAKNITNDSLFFGCLVDYLVSSNFIKKIKHEDSLFTYQMELNNENKLYTHYVFRHINNISGGAIKKQINDNVFLYESTISTLSEFLTDKYKIKFIAVDNDDKFNFVIDLSYDLQNLEKYLKDQYGITLIKIKELVTRYEISY